MGFTHEALYLPNLAFNSGFMLQSRLFSQILLSVVPAFTGSDLKVLINTGLIS